MRRIIAVLVGTLLVLSLTAVAQNSYIGSKMCGMCHKTDKQGKQLDIWQKSKHAEAFKTLESPKALEIAKAKGITKLPSEAAECLECHVVKDPKFMKDGVQCESCHGPGSAYKSVMKDKAKALKAGLAEFKDDAAIEKLCKTCHNEKSPTHKAFDFKEMWPKIKHPIPKG